MVEAIPGATRDGAGLHQGSMVRAFTTNMQQEKNMALTGHPSYDK